jgi:hypothetical protein
MLQNKINGTFPNFEFGFPKTLYYQFLFKKNELQHGLKRGLFIDVLFSIIIALLYVKIKNNKTK